MKKREVDPFEYIDDPAPLNEAMRSGLARVYIDKDFHDYLVHSIQMANKGVMVCVQQGNLDKARTYADRLDWLKTLLNQMRNSFVTVPKIKEERIEALKTKDEQHG